MYYISQDTYDQLPDEFQEKALGDTRKYYKQNGVPLPTELITGSSPDKKGSSESDQETLIDEKAKANESSKDEAKAVKKIISDDADECGECGESPCSCDEEPPKTWDGAHKKGMTLIIAIGKRKPGQEDDSE